MEFEVNENQKSEITEEERLRAQTRSKTLQPVNPFLTPDDTPDPIVVNETHGNIELDAEDTSKRDRLVHPATSAAGVQSSHFLSRGALIAGAVGFGAFGAIGLFLLFAA